MRQAILNICRGVTRLGEVRLAGVWHGVFWLVRARSVAARFGGPGSGPAGRGVEWCGGPSSGKAWCGRLGLVVFRRGLAWFGLVSIGRETNLDRASLAQVRQGTSWSAAVRSGWVGHRWVGWGWVRRGQAWRSMFWCGEVRRAVSRRVEASWDQSVVWRASARNNS